MKITAKVTKIEKGNLRGYATVTLEEAIVLRSIRILEDQNGLYVSMPSRPYTDKDGEKKYSDYFFPCTKEAREELVGVIMDAYNAAE